MKSVFALFAAALICSSALAVEPFDNEEVSMLAMAVALQNSCTKIDPAQEKRYTGLLEMIRKDVSTEKREQIDNAMKSKNFDSLVKNFQVNFEQMERARLMEQCEGIPRPKEQ
ncbi:MAG: hypothetical protein LBE33_10130 [Zoogloeaceae bacterium]|jgi:hypothetical protein|nr:hypothetical protein [Zoogloeaceae bacterium]